MSYIHIPLIAHAFCIDVQYLYRSRTVASSDIVRKIIQILYHLLQIQDLILRLRLRQVYSTQHDSMMNLLTPYTLNCWEKHNNTFTFTLYITSQHWLK